MHRVHAAAHRGLCACAALLLAACSSVTPGTGGAPWPQQDPASPAAMAALDTRIRGLMQGLPGEAGVYMRHLPTGATIEVAADDTFPTASMIKLPLLVALFDEVRQGRLALDAKYTLTDSAVVQTDDEDIIGLGMTVDLRKLAFLMTAASDNTASVWIQELIGGSATANRWLEANGFRVLRNNSRFAERREFHRRWGWGMTSPREMAELLVMVREGRAVDARASGEMYRLMTGSFWYGEALSGIPPYVAAASKQGWLTRSRSEVLLVHSPGGEYVLAVITKDQPPEIADRADHPGDVLLRRVSWEVWHHFNPADPWRPAWHGAGGAAPARR
jgi:beta-lactamase class A